MTINSNPTVTVNASQNLEVHNSLSQLYVRHVEAEFI